eukprot:4097870-Karenia_brevis.AAC.1
MQGRACEKGHEDVYGPIESDLRTRNTQDIHQHGFTRNMKLVIRQPSDGDRHHDGDGDGGDGDGDGDGD